jgi:antitoxin component of MazEF toxin-antitoxin module
MTTKVKRVGSSLAVRIPLSVARRAEIANGDAVEFEVAKGALTIRTSRSPRKLKVLVAGINSKNRPQEIGWSSTAKGTKVDIERMRSALGRGKRALRGKTVEQWMEWLRGPVELP